MSTEDDDFDLDEFLMELDDEIPLADRLGIFTDTAVDFHPRFSEVADRLDELVAATEPYVDDDGIIWQIVVATVDRARERAIWVEWKERESGRVVDTHYFLKARDPEGLAVVWEVETYNPYAGCTIHFLAWHGADVVTIYTDKHDTFVAALGRSQPVRRRRINPEWRVVGDVLFHRSGEPNVADRLRLPALEEMGSASADEARGQG